MNPLRVAGYALRIALPILFVWALLAGHRFVALAAGVATAYAWSRSLVHAIFELPGLMRAVRYGPWMGIYQEFDGRQIRTLPDPDAGEQVLVAVEDVEVAIGRTLQRVEGERVPADGLLLGVRCARADAIERALEPYLRAGTPEKRARTLRFSRWLKDDLVGPARRRTTDQ